MYTHLLKTLQKTVALACSLQVMMKINHYNIIKNNSGKQYKVKSEALFLLNKDSKKKKKKGPGFTTLLVS